MPYTDIVDVDVPADRVAGAGAVAAQDLIKVTAKQREIRLRANLLSADLTGLTQRVDGLPAPFAGTYAALTGNMDPARISQSASYRLVTDTLIASWTAKATTQDIATAITTYDTGAKAGVPAAGDNFLKLYNLVIGGFSEKAVGTLAERNAYNVPRLPLNVFVTDDGDGKWALYRATSTGVNATYVKLSDPDLLNAAILLDPAPTAASPNGVSSGGVFTAISNAVTGLKDNVASAYDTLNKLYTWVSGQLNLKASLNSPTFTGTPAVPTAGVNTASTQIASTQFVSVATGNLIDNAPVAANTLGKLYVALFGSFTNTKLQASVVPTVAAQYYSAGPVNAQGNATSIISDADLQLLANRIAPLLPSGSGGGGTTTPYAAPGEATSAVGKTTVPLSPDANTVDKYEIEPVFN